MSKLKYPLLERRDLTKPSDRTFADPGSYSEKFFIVETGDSDQTFSPSGTFDDGFKVSIYNKGPNEVTFDAAIPQAVILPEKSAVFIYDATSANWYGMEGVSNKTTLDGRQVFVQDSQPSDSVSEEGDLWIQIV